MKQKVIIGSRGSQLALWQSNFVKRELEKKHKGISVSIKIIKTTGDKILDVALSQIGDKSLFTKELENELLNKTIDLAVHSLKDLQTKIPEGLKLSAVGKRHKVEDVLIARKKRTTLYDIPENGTIATGSLRRSSQVLHLRPDLNIEDLRGNVPSRIEKFLKSSWDGIILARAGVERLKLNKYISSFIPVDEILPAVGQGALAIEIHEDNKLADELLRPLHDEDTWTAVTAERAFLRELEGGCQVPIGAFAEVKTNGIYLDGFVGSLDGMTTFRKRIRGKKSAAELTGKALAKDMIKAGAKEVLDEIYNSGRRK